MDYKYLLVKVPLWKVKQGLLSLKRLNKRTKLILIAVLLALILIVGGRVVIGGRSGKITESGGGIEVKDPTETLEINREFSFPLKNSEGEEVNQIKYIVENAELREEIIVQGQRATAVKGRIFLILNLKITNEYQQAIEINTRDYLRLSVGGRESELLAPDIHNDPVEIQAISTKYTRLGFPINEADKYLTLFVGEINGEKQKIDMQFK